MSFPSCLSSVFPHENMGHCGCISTISYKLNDKNVHNIQYVEHFHGFPLSWAMKAHVRDESFHSLPTIIGRHGAASFSLSLLRLSHLIFKSGNRVYDFHQIWNDQQMLCLIWWQRNIWKICQEFSFVKYMCLNLICFSISTEKSTVFEDYLI